MTEQKIKKIIIIKLNLKSMHNIMWAQRDIKAEREGLRVWSAVMSSSVFNKSPPHCGSVTYRRTLFGLSIRRSSTQPRQV